MSQSTPIAAEEATYVTNQWSRNVVQPILSALLITALAAAVLIVFETVGQNRSWLPFSIMILFVTLEGVYTTLWLNQPERRPLNHTAYRAAELVVLALLIRLFTWIMIGNWPNLSQFQEYLKYPQLLINDGFFIGGAILSLLTWQRAIALSDTFARLALDRAEVHYYSLPANERISGDKPVRVDRSGMVAAFFQQWIWGGVLLALCTAVSTLDFTAVGNRSILGIGRLGLRPELLVILITYFLAGFVLLSQARLEALNARWLHAGVAKGKQVERSWHRSSVWLLLAVAAIALFLPLGSTFGISRILGTIAYVVTTIASFLGFLFLSLLSLLFSPLGLEQSEPEVSAEPLPTLAPQPTPAPPLIPEETTTLVFSSFFWAVAIVMSIVAVSFFLRERGFRFKTALFKQAWISFTAWLQSIWRGAANQARDWQHTVRTRLRIRPTPEEEKNKPPWRFIRLNALPPREQIRYFYLSTVKRAGDKGVERKTSETPLEYAQDLKENWPEAETDVDVLTDAFLEAQYSRKEIEKDDVNPVKRRWKQVKSSLRKRRRQDE